MTRRLAWSAWVLAILFLAGWLVTLAWSDDLMVRSIEVLFLLPTIGAVTTGLLVALRVPGNAVGWILLFMGVGLAFALVCTGYLSVSVDRDGAPLPGALVAGWVLVWTTVPVVYGSAIFLLLLYPDGRLPSPRWRWVAWFATLVLVAATVASALTARELAPGAVNPFAATGRVADVVRVTEEVTNLLGLPLVLLAGFALVLRLRRAQGDERLQLKSFTYSAVLTGLGLGLSGVMSGPLAAVLFTLGWLALAGLPVSAGLAILRYRLYDIDVVINRTLVYGTSTALLGATYFGLVLVLGAAVSPLTSDTDLAVAGSTLVVAAAFRPLRSRVQAAVDRRFYRRRYDAQHTLEAFGAHLRHELDLDSVGRDLRAAVTETVQPVHVSLWLRTEP